MNDVHDFKLNDLDEFYESLVPQMIGKYTK